MHLGGMLDDKKSAVYKLVHPRYLPQTIIIKKDDNIEAKIKEAGLNYPLIVKPDVGFKGFMVRKVDSLTELNGLKASFGQREMLLQEFVDTAKEYSIMCYKLNRSSTYEISSFVEKILPYIVGDGITTIEDLIINLSNPFLKKEIVLYKFRTCLHDILPKGQKMIIDHVGNYARGSKFYNRSKQIDEDLTRAMNNFFTGINGLNFGRLDLKADSIDDIKNGNFKLLEINGAKAEPIHIYDPTMSISSMMKDISFHWRTLFKIVKENQHHQIPSTAEGLRSFRSLKKAVNP